MRAKQKVDKWADQKADGLLKIRALHARAGIRVVPYTESEMRAALVAAKDEFDSTGTLCADTFMTLNTVGYDAEEVLQLWNMISKADINFSQDDAPISTIGDNEEPEYDYSKESEYGE